MTLDEFSRARYGMFIHYGLYSQLGRGEWVMNRERISPAEMERIAEGFDPSAFNADALCALAVAGGMKYITLTTMHHEGFRLYDTELSDFNSMRVCGRDLVAEMVAAARKYGLGIGLYHSLNNWFDAPDASDALESPDAYEAFIANTHARLEELVTRFKPVDVIWYDGWWPFDAQGWRSEEMNQRLRAIQPDLLFNGRNGLSGDFGTPEGHMSAPKPWRPWEACMTLNDNWGYHAGDTHWKPACEVIDLLMKAAQGKGNLLLNIGPRGDGSVPEASERIVRRVGEWLAACGECLEDLDHFTWGLRSREGNEADWSHHGPFTRSGTTLHQILRNPPAGELTLGGFESTVRSATLLDLNGPVDCLFTQDGELVQVSSLPAPCATDLPAVLKLVCDTPPVIRLGGGMRVPSVPHPPYDPCESDIGHE